MKEATWLFLLGTLLLCMASCDRLMERGAKSRLSQTQSGLELLDDGNLHVVLVGTGGPMPNDERVSVATAIIAGGEFILVDTGPGTIRNAMLQQLPLGNLSAVFLTHFHSDHIADLGEANMYSWVQGNRKERLPVYGPEGVEQVVKGYTTAYALDSVYRTAHHGEDVAPTSGAKPIANTIPIKTPGKAELFFDRNGLKAWAFEVDHFPARPAVGYRFEYKGRVVVLTGDTKRIPTLAKHAHKADLFIADALDAKMIHVAARVSSDLNLPKISKIFTDITDYHLTPVEAAQVAQQASVKKLVFYHVVPPITNFMLKRQYLKGVKEAYDGDVEIGKDGMRFTLATEKQ